MLDLDLLLVRRRLPAEAKPTELTANLPGRSEKKVRARGELQKETCCSRALDLRTLRMLEAAAEGRPTTRNTLRAAPTSAIVRASQVDEPARSLLLVWASLLAAGFSPRTLLLVCESRSFSWIPARPSPTLVRPFDEERRGTLTKDWTLIWLAIDQQLMIEADEGR